MLLPWTNAAEDCATEIINTAIMMMIEDMILFSNIKERFFFPLSLFRAKIIETLTLIFFQFAPATIRVLRVGEDMILFLLL